MKRNTRIILLFLFLSVLPVEVSAQTEFIGKSELKSLQWGGEDGWHDIYSFTDTTKKRGPLQEYAVQLADNSPRKDEHTELLLNFDLSTRNRIFFQSELYREGEVDIFPSPDIKKFGDRSAGFLHYENIIEVSPLEGSIFQTTSEIESFTIDFYLCPTSIHDGSEVFSWHAPVVELNGRYTGIKAFFREGRLFWLLEHLFQDSSGERYDILIEENTEIQLREWHHHALIYDASNGMLALFHDGEESNIRWITVDGKEGSTRLRGYFSPYLKVPVAIGKSYYGYIDELRISRGRPRFYLGNFRDHGKIKSDVIDIEHKGTRIVSIQWDASEENGTAVRVFFRFSEMYFDPSSEADDEQWTDSSDSLMVSSVEHPYTLPRWIQVRNGEHIAEQPPGGRYLQWKALLYGTNGLYTPSLLSLRVTLELDPPPSAPILLHAQPQDGAVRLVWVKNKESDLKGYKIYYGNDSKNYFGKHANAGESPFNVGRVESFVVEGLKNEEVYFFSITAFDEADQESGFSNELIVRPSSVYSTDR
jgi:hypothetical protein